MLPALPLGILVCHRCSVNATLILLASQSHPDLPPMLSGSAFACLPFPSLLLDVSLLEIWDSVLLPLSFTGLQSSVLLPASSSCPNHTDVIKRDSSTWSSSLILRQHGPDAHTGLWCSVFLQSLFTSTLQHSAVGFSCLCYGASLRLLRPSLCSSLF